MQAVMAIMILVETTKKEIIGRDIIISKTPLRQLLS
jgi:hypothetical protein